MSLLDVLKNVRNFRSKFNKNKNIDLAFLVSFRSLLIGIYIMFIDATKSAVKMADWGLIKIEGPLAVKDVDNVAAPISAVTTTTTTTNIDRKSLELTVVVSEVIF